MWNSKKYVLRRIMTEFTYVRHTLILVKYALFLVKYALFLSKEDLILSKYALILVKHTLMLSKYALILDKYDLTLAISILSKLSVTYRYILFNKALHLTTKLLLHL